MLQLFKDQLIVVEQKNNFSNIIINKLDKS
ncbi:MAG: hypothetical protein ACP5IC_00135 [Minisyncoccia bacterium]